MCQGENTWTTNNLCRLHFRGVFWQCQGDIRQALLATIDDSFGTSAGMRAETATATLDGSMFR